MSDEDLQPYADELPEPAAHMMQSDLERFAKQECAGEAYSEAVGGPDGRSEALFTEAQLRAILADAYAHYAAQVLPRAGLAQPAGGSGQMTAAQIAALMRLCEGLMRRPEDGDVPLSIDRAHELSLLIGRVAAQLEAQPDSDTSRPAAYRIDWPAEAGVGLPRFFGADDSERMRNWTQPWRGGKVVPLFAAAPALAQHHEPTPTDEDRRRMGWGA